MRFFKKATRKVEESLDPDIEKTEFFAILNKIRDDVLNRRMKPRTSIYLNENRLLDMLSQCFRNFNQYASVYELSGHAEGKAGILVTEIKGGITSKEGRTVHENIRPLIAAWILEYCANKNRLLADMPYNGSANEPFCAILEGFIVSRKEIRNKQNFQKISDIKDGLLKQIEDMLLDQAEKGKTETLAWIHPYSTKILASILDRRFIADDNYMSYQGFAPLGFFGLSKPEIPTPEVDFLTPLWIWQER